MKLRTIIPAFVLMVSIIFLTCAKKKVEPDNVKKTKIVRYGSLIGLKKEYEERYIILHKHTFPGVLDRIRKSNIRNYSIFLREEVLFSHFEYIGSDFDADMNAIANETTKEWWKLTDPMQAPLENRKEGEWWASMELLFQMDTSKVSYENAERCAFMADLKENQKQDFKEKLKQMDISTIQSLLDANIQNLTVYARDGQVYVCYEYVGVDFKRDMEQITSNDKFKALNADLKAMLKPISDEDVHRTWYAMKEVFHTE